MHAAQAALRPDPLVQWPEAAALVRQIADQIADARLEGVPALADLAIDANGIVHLRPKASRPVGADDESTAAALRALFQELVGGNPIPAPVERGLHSSHDGTPIDSAEALSRALGYFVRPSADRDLRAVAARMSELDEETRLRREVEALTRQARVADVHPPAGDKAPAAPARRRMTKRRVLAAATAVGALSVAALFFGPSGSEGLATAAPVLRQGTSLVKKAARVVFGREEVEAAAAIEVAPPAPAPIRKSRFRPVVPSLPQLAVTIDTAIVKPSSPWTLPMAFTTPVVASPARADVAPSSPFDYAVFDSRDKDVTPAAVVRPYLRSDPVVQDASAQFGRLEVVVAATGEVERVRLLATTPERRYHDAMLVHAAKNWVFRPARRQGIAVRYRLEIPLIN